MHGLRPAFWDSEVKGTLPLTLPSLASGSHTLNVVVNDNAGATGSFSGTFKVDADAPAITSVNVNGKSVTEAQALSFTLGDTANMIVTAADIRGGNDVSTSPVVLGIYVGGTLVKTVSSGTAFDLATLIGSATSVQTVRVVALDTAANVSAPRTFTIQFSAATGGTPGGGVVVSEPVLSWLAPTGDYVRGSGSVTLRASAIKAGQDISSQVTYTTTCGTVSGSTWVLGADCTDGSKQTVTATLVDNGKNYSIAKTITVDASDPTVQITSPQQGQSFSNNPVNVTFTATDSGSGIDHVEVMATDAGGVKQMVGTVSAASGTVVWAPQNGTYTLTAVAYDKVGRTATTSLGNVKVQLSSTDNQAPSVTTLTLPAGPQRRTVTVTAAVSDPSPSSGIAKVELFEGGTSLGVQTAGVGGVYTFSLDTGRLTDALHTIRAMVTDNVGLTGEKTGSLTTDNTAPAVTWQSPQSTVVGAKVTLNAITNEGTVAYTVDGAPVNDTDAVQAGFQVSLSDGLHTLVAIATDAAGNTSSASLSVTADGTAPVTSILSPASGTSITQNPVTVQVSASDALSGVDRIEVSAVIGGVSTLIGTVNGAQGSVTWVPTNGSYTLKAVSYDKARNASTEVTSSVTVALPPASSTITAGAPATTAAGVSGSNPVFVRGLGAVSGTATSTATLTAAQLLVDGQANGTPSNSSGSASFNFDFSTLNEGLHTLALRWQDSASTVTDSDKLSVYVDKTAPVVTWNKPATDTVTNVVTVTLDASATDGASGVGSVTYSENGTAIGTPTSWTPGEGAHTVTATATDKVGNSSSKSITLTIDQSGPVITATSPTNAQEFSTPSVTVSATATDNLTGVASMEATIQGPKDVTPVTLGLQIGGNYSAAYKPVDAGTYTVVFKALGM